MKRLAKIEDEDEDFTAEMRAQEPSDSHLSMTETPAAIDDVLRSGPRDQMVGAEMPITRRRTGSMRSLSQSNLPKGARPTRPSWSAQDFKYFNSPDIEETRRGAASFGTNDPADDTLVTSSPSQTRKSGHSRTSSIRSGSRAEAAVEPDLSGEKLRVGGEVSTRDTIGIVPAPIMQPRGCSSRGSRSSSFADHGSDRFMPAAMTPAQEKDGWVACAFKKLEGTQE